MLQEKKQGIMNLYALAAYGLFAFILLAKYPLSGSLTGNMDTWYYMGVFHTFINEVDGFFTGCETGVYAYPFPNTLVLGDATWASGAVYYLLFKALRSDVWAYYVLMAAIFTLNGFGFYTVSRSLKFSFTAALCGGFLFAFSNFFFGNIDNQNSIAIFPALFAIANWIMFSNDGDRKKLVWSAFFIGVQVYFSTYNFFFGLVILAVYTLYSLLKREMKKYLSLANVLMFGLIVLGVISLFVVNYYPLSNYPTRANLEMLAPSFCDYGLSVADFSRSAEGNLVYSFKSDISNIWRYNNKSVFTGLIFLGLIIGGVYKSGHKWLYVAGVIIGLIIAIGPYISIGGNCYKAPMYILYKYVSVINIIRTPVRAFYIVLFFCALAAVDFLSRYNIRWYAVLGILILFFLENIPLKAPVFASAKYLNYSPPLINDCKTPLLNILEIPSNGNWNEGSINRPLNNYNREFIYYYHQTVHGHNLVNMGYLNYIPIALPIADTVNINNFDAVVKKWEVDYIIMNRDFILDSTDNQLIDSITGFYRTPVSFDNNGNMIIRTR